MRATHQRVPRADGRFRRPKLVMLSVGELDGLSADQCAALTPVTETFPFRTNDYYVSLIDWTDPADPIRRLIVPTAGELATGGALDPSNEASNTPVRGLQHKYADTALLLVTDQCASFCRYCFRKRLFLEDSRETTRLVDEGLEYIRAHSEIRDVLLTGGDPLTLATSRLAAIVDAVAATPHVKTIRIGSKLPAFNPSRIADDQRLLELVERTVQGGVTVYFMCHFDHPKELTPEAVTALGALQAAGAMTVNQCPVTRGINDDAAVLSELFQKCTDSNCPQYYAFQCRPTRGNREFSVPVTRAFDLFTRATHEVSGLSRRARFCLSHATGKVEVVGMDERHVYARYHRAKDPRDHGRMLVLARNDDAHWLDDFDVVGAG